jgi:hypothetical protein
MPFTQDGAELLPLFLSAEERRFLLRSELDAAFFHLYLPAETSGDCRTKPVILEIDDTIQKSIHTGCRYQTLLDPPPADPCCCHPPKGGHL